MALRLIIEDDEGTTTVVPLGSDAVTIGRQQGNTIQLTEKNVSRRHARLYPESEVWVIEDLGSYNGIKVNGQAIDARVNLKEGDVVQIGDYHLALTEDVDKRSLNYDGQQAANDNEPMLVSSSSDLPRLSADELASLQSGPQAAQPGALTDSGPMPAAMAGGYEEQQQSKAGVYAFLVVLLIGGLGGGVWWYLTQGGNTGADTGTPTKTSAAAPANTQPGPAKAPPSPAKAVVNPPPNQPPAADSGAAAAPPAQGSAGQAPPSPPPAPVPVEDEPEVIEDTPPDAAPAAPTGGGNKNKNKSKKKKKQQGGGGSDPSTPPPAPTPAPAPAVDADQLLADARAAIFKNPSRAYTLAKKAYGHKRSSEAAQVMANAACRMKDAGKAKSALSKLKGKTREQMTKICRDKGVDV